MVEKGNYNIINNYYKYGPATRNHVKDRIFEAYYAGSYGKFYVDGNFVYGFPSVTENNWLGIRLNSGGNKNDLIAYNHSISLLLYILQRKKPIKTYWDMQEPV